MDWVIVNYYRARVQVASGETFTVIESEYFKKKFDLLKYIPVVVGILRYL